MYRLWLQNFAETRKIFKEVLDFMQQKQFIHN